MLNGIDASSWQSVTQVDQAEGAGGRFLIHKATEGLTFRDPAHAARTQLARSRGWQVGHYHFAHPSQSATREAAFFLKTAAARPGDVLALDMEKAEGSWAQRLAYARTFCAYVHDHTGASPWIYLNTSWIMGIPTNRKDCLRGVASAEAWADLTRWPLWLAYWPYSGKPAVFPKVPWPVVTCQQYADHPIADHDVFFGDAGTWAKLAIPHPAPHPTPKPPTPTKPVPPAALSVHVPGLAHDVTLTLKH